MADGTGKIESHLPWHMPAFLIWPIGCKAESKTMPRVEQPGCGSDANHVLNDSFGNWWLDKEGEGGF
jgi:hypothetical protein